MRKKNPRAGNRKDSPIARTDNRRCEISAVVLVLTVAVLIRVVYLLQYKAQVPFYSALVGDSFYYDTWARRVAEGGGYGPKPFYLAPLYPYVLALIYKLIGHSLPVVYVLQSILGVANLVLVYLLGRRMSGHRAGLAGMICLLLCAPVLYLESKILTETVSITLSLASLLVLAGAVERPRVLSFGVAGVMLGLGALCRPVALIFAAFALVWLLTARWSEQRVRFSAILAVGAVLIILPVTVRNYTVGRDLALISTNAGMTFTHGNNPYSTGVCTVPPGFTTSIMEQQDEEMRLADKALHRKTRPSESSSYWLRQGLRFAVENPWIYVGLIGRKVLWSFHNRESACNYNVYLEQQMVPVLRWLFMPFSVLLGLGVYGYMLVRRETPGVTVSLTGTYIASIFLSLLIFFVSSRYRAPLVPALCVLAGIGTVRLLDVVRSRRCRELTSGIACLVLAIVPSLVEYPVAPITAEAPANMGYSFLQIGQPEEAADHFREALRLKPDYEYAREKLAEALAESGNSEEAVDEYEEAVKRDPGNAEKQNNLGAVLEKQGRIDDAIARYIKAVQLKPGFAVAHRNLGNLLAQQGRLDEAVAHLSRALQSTPDDANAHYDLGVLYGRMEKLDAEIQEYRTAIRIKADLAPAHNNLAVALFMKGDYPGAWAEVKLSREFGITPDADFIRELSSAMPDPDAVEWVH